MSEQRHLRRLTEVWQKQPVYFITACTANRQPVLACDTVHKIFRDEWKCLTQRHGWAVGRYVIMPDHVHFFAMPLIASGKPMSVTIGRWKEWTAKRTMAALRFHPPFWQPEFFDHLLRSSESRSEKWAYVRENPVRAGLAIRAEDWPYAGTIDFE